MSYPSANLPTPADLLPQAGPAMLLDGVTAVSADSLHATVCIGPASRWRTAEGVPVHVAIEYMAQACAAFVGLEARRGGGAPRPGFLLGTRDFRATTSWFTDGQVLEVRARVEFRDEEIGVFDTAIVDGDVVLCEARLTVFQPREGASLPTRPEGGDA